MSSFKKFGTSIVAKQLECLADGIYQMKTWSIFYGVHGFEVVVPKGSLVTWLRQARRQNLVVSIQLVESTGSDK